jgi:ubiquinone biosynthesis protein COQ9
MASSGAASLRSQLLRSAVPLVKDYGFTREALARSVLTPNNQPSFKAHDEPLSDEAVSALFGQGDDARRTLIRAWLDEGLNSMRVQTDQPTLRQVLHARLAYNEPALGHIPEVHTRFRLFKK